MFNDMLGTTLGSIQIDTQNSSLSISSTTAFGEAVSDSPALPVSDSFHTGKPYVPGLGYAFLFRNYRPSLGKRQTSDPLGYPDGWNNFAYVNNGVTMAFDWLGAKIIFHGEAVKYEQTVKAYICRGPTGKKIWDALSNSTSFNVDVGDYNNEGPPGPFWDPENNQIAWNPHEYAEFERDGKELHLSPALLLAHELAHAYREMNGEADENRENEEKAVIGDYENKIAHDLGEPERTWEEYNDTEFYNDKKLYPNAIPE